MAEQTRFTYRTLNCAVCQTGDVSITVMMAFVLAIPATFSAATVQVAIHAFAVLRPSHTVIVVRHTGQRADTRLSVAPVRHIYTLAA